MESIFIAEATFKNKNKLKVFAMTLLPFQVALLATVKNDLIIAWYVHTRPEIIALKYIYRR